MIEISLKSGAGTDKLLSAITERVGTIDFEMSFVRDEREANLLRRAVNHLHEAQETIRRNFGIDFISIDLHAALECLSELTGEAVGEDVLNEIFSKFCIGKWLSRLLEFGAADFISVVVNVESRRCEVF